MKCPYSEIECSEVNISSEPKLNACNMDCQHYNPNDVRATGATPVLAWIIEKLENLFKKSGKHEKEIIDVSKLNIKDNATNFVCQQCDHRGTDVCNGCTAPYE